MEQARTVVALHDACQALRHRFDALALVPTMSALHDRHHALAREAAASGVALNSAHGGLVRGLPG